MFNKDRYITRGIQYSLNEELINTLWHFIGLIEGEKDYLQVFEIEPIDKQKRITKVTHRQEVLNYEREYAVNAKIDETVKVFVIDDGEYCTMMLAEEY